MSAYLANVMSVLLNPLASDLCRNLGELVSSKYSDVSLVLTVANQYDPYHSLCIFITDNEVQVSVEEDVNTHIGTREGQFIPEHVSQESLEQLLIEFATTDVILRQDFFRYVQRILEILFRNFY